MSLEDPFPTEQLRDGSFEEMIRHLCSQPGMWVLPDHFATVCAYLDGFNTGRHGGPLLGFREWLVVQLNEGNNLHWIGLVEYFIPKDQSERERIKSLGDLIQDYLRYRSEQGITKVFYDYGQWLLRKRWYHGPLRKKGGPGSR